jgi:hypothetical protein
MKKIVLLLISLFFGLSSFASAQRTTINLDGTWDFAQTKKAFPPQEFGRKIPVPGLISLAKPTVEQYKKLLQNTASQPRYSVKNLDYTPKYSWYRLKVKVPANLKGTNAVLTLLKSKYGTEVYINGKDVGGGMSPFTPIDVPVTHALKFGGENTILIRVGDLTQLPIQVPGIMDFEKRRYFPGIWDDVYLSFTGDFRVHRMLALPSVTDHNLTTKLLIRSFYPTIRFGRQYEGIVNDTCNVGIIVRKKDSGQVVAKRKKTVVIPRERRKQIKVTVPMKNAHLWSPKDPFLYTYEIKLYDHGKVSDDTTATFGMRDFTRRGKHFFLNGKKIYLRGSNITLHRFFEDPDSKALPWNRKWVTKLLSNIPEKLHWNAFRICVGIVPRFWYDIADSLGIMLQNESTYWVGGNKQQVGWSKEIKKEFTDWVWSDGNHPSIVIWDAMNESYNPYISKQLIPQLEQLDPTRIWDNGYATQKNMRPGEIDAMDEPHIYMEREKHTFRLGDLGYHTAGMSKAINRSAAQVVNEYGWSWLWRNGEPSKISKHDHIYQYYLGKNSTPSQNRFFQAYDLQLQTEWFRAHRQLAGVLSFDYLSNDHGYTGDWFIGDIKNQTPGPTLKWFRDAFAPSAVFIDLTDQRYVKNTTPCKPGSRLDFNLVGVNDFDHKISGKVTVVLLNSKGKQTGKTITQTITIPAYGKKLLPTSIELPKQKGGYLVVAKYRPNMGYQMGKAPIISRRYINIGKLKKYQYYDLSPQPLDKVSEYFK